MDLIKELQTTSISKSMEGLVMDEIRQIRDANPDFQEAFDTYVQQYGNGKIALSDPIYLGRSIDPVVLVIGRNCVITYSDSQKMLKGTQGNLVLQPKGLYVVGRRQPQDSKLVVWNTKGGTELEEYNSRVDTIPSRVHGVIGSLEDGNTLYADLGSSAGTILVGQSPALNGAFVRLYDPGSKEFPGINFERKFTEKRV